jgi:hypothetical protein
MMATVKIIDDLRQINTDAKRREAVSQFVALIHTIIASQGDPVLGRSMAQTHFGGMGGVAAVYKAAVPSGSLDSDSAIAAITPLADQFLGSLTSLSVLDLLLASGMQSIPLRTRIVSVTATGTAHLVNEAQAQALTFLNFQPNDLLAKSAIALVAVSDWVMRYGVAGATQLLENELAKAVSAATNKQFLADLYGGVSPSASAGGTLANLRTDLKTLLAAISVRAQSRLFLIVEPGNCLAMAMVGTTGGQRAFPDVGMQGGEVAPGLTVVPSDQTPTGGAILVDATGLAGNSGILSFGNAHVASVQLSDSPNSPVDNSAVLIPLWQSGLIGLQCRRDFGVEVARPNSVAALSGVAWSA